MATKAFYNADVSLDFKSVITIKLESSGILVFTKICFHY